jgi:hypothetical protein
MVRLVINWRHLIRKAKRVNPTVITIIIARVKTSEVV